MSGIPDIFQKRELLVWEEAKREIQTCNEVSERFGLTLTDTEIEELVLKRKESLRNSGRVEFGGGILPKLIYAFCDSPFMEQDRYMETLIELQEAFYYFKTESLDHYSDDEVIEFMAAVFNGRARGSTEYLISTSLEALIRYTRSGYDPRNADEAGDLF